MMTALSARIGLHPSTHPCHSRALVRVHVCDNCATNGAASESNGRARAGGRTSASIFTCTRRVGDCEPRGGGRGQTWVGGRKRRLRTVNVTVWARREGQAHKLGCEVAVEDSGLLHRTELQQNLRARQRRPAARDPAGQPLRQASV